MYLSCRPWYPSFNIELSPIFISRPTFILDVDTLHEYTILISYTYLQNRYDTTTQHLRITSKLRRDGYGEVFFFDTLIYDHSDCCNLSARLPYSYIYIYTMKYKAYRLEHWIYPYTFSPSFLRFLSMIFDVRLDINA